MQKRKKQLTSEEQKNSSYCGCWENPMFSYGTMYEALMKGKENAEKASKNVRLKCTYIVSPQVTGHLKIYFQIYYRYNSHKFAQQSLNILSKYNRNGKAIVFSHVQSCIFKISEQPKHCTDQEQQYSFGFLKKS